MKVQKINGSVYCKNDAETLPSTIEHGKISDTKKSLKTNLVSEPSHDEVSFKGAGGGDFSKRAWLAFRKLSNYMKDASEMTNAWIAFIGTGAIAPIAIMSSPARSKSKTGEPMDKQKAKEKKKFQALRQPVSAFLAFCFQLPTTIGIAKLFNHLAYDKHIKFFDDDTLGHLIPNKKYLKGQAKDVIKGKGGSSLISEWQNELNQTSDINALKTELMNQIRKDYEEVGITISDAELERKATQSKINEFRVEKMVKAREENLLNAKIEELKNRNFEIKDIDLVTSDYQDLARQRYKAEFETLERKANLNAFDKFIRLMGISNDKLDKLEKAQKDLAKERGLEFLKADMPEVFNGDKMARLKKFIENKNVNAQKLYGNKVFWLTLVTNLGMVAISCEALNRLHPKFADFVDGMKQAKKEIEASKEQKAEVEA